MPGLVKSPRVELGHCNLDSFGVRARCKLVLGLLALLLLVTSHFKFVICFYHPVYLLKPGITFNLGLEQVEIYFRSTLTQV